MMTFASLKKKTTTSKLDTANLTFRAAERNSIKTHPSKRWKSLRVGAVPLSLRLAIIMAVYAGNQRVQTSRADMMLFSLFYQRNKVVFFGT